MPRQWTLEQKQRQSLLIRQWQPWQQSIGPKTEFGKAVVSQNAIKHGKYCAEAIAEQSEISQILREARDLLAMLNK